MEKEMKMKYNINKNTSLLMIVVAVFVLTLVAKLVYAAIYYAEATTNSGGSLTANSYTNNSIYDGPIAVNNFNYYIGDFDVTGRTEEITGVEICFDIYTLFTSCSGQCDEFYLSYSFDGSEGSPTTLETLNSINVNYTDGSPTGHKCYDVTLAASWTWTTVSQTNIHIVGNKNQGPDTYSLYSDYLYIKVTYTPPDTTEPVVQSLDYPGDGTYVNTNTVDFNFTATDNYVLSNCTLWGNFTPPWNANTTIYNVQNNTETNITIYVADGIYEWNVECFDNNSNFDFYNSNYTVYVDTKPPAIYLEAPENHNYTETSTNIFYFNTTDQFSNVTSCELIIDNVTKGTTTDNPVLEGVTYNLSASLTNGDHYWWINCTDQSGWENVSEKRNISVNVQTPTIQTVLSSYEQGQTADITGENWGNTNTVTINITLNNGSNVLFNTTSSAAGVVTTEYNISYDHPIGWHNLSAFNPSTPGDNATNEFEVTARVAAITISKSAYYEGESVYINGSGFSPNTTITLNFTHSSGSEAYIHPVNSSGKFNFTYNLSYTEILGVWNLTVIDSNYTNLNDTGNFTVSDRMAIVYTDKSLYDPTETVYLFGSWYSSLGEVLLTLKDIDSGEISPGYPLVVDAEELGNFTHNWTINDTCAGNFSFNAYDQAHTELNDTAFFNISVATDYLDSTPVSAYSNSPPGPVSVALLNESLDDYAVVNINTKNVDEYLEANWSHNFSSGTSIDSVILTLEHIESSSIPTINIKWFNGASYQTVLCTGISNIQTEANQTCDLSGYITNYSQANNISLRVVYRYSTGGSSTGSIDQIRLNITYSGESACTEWGNSAPLITSVDLPPSVDLLAGQTQTVYCNASVTDSEDDLVSANATFYYYLNSSQDPDDNNDHYTNSVCTFSGTATKTVNCPFNVWYYAKNGTWYCEVTVADAEYASSLDANTTVNPLYAVNISPSFVDYGNVPKGGNSNEITVNITNLGNRPLNFSVWGFGSDNNATGGELSFICDEQGNITVGYERYATVASTSYSAKTNLTSGPVDVSMTIPKQTQQGVYSQNFTYWEMQVGVDNDPAGECNGSIVFEAGTT